MPAPVVILEITGLEGVRLVAMRLPKIPAEAIDGIIEGIRDSGVQVAQTTLLEGASPLSSGETARRMQGIITKQEEPQEWRLQIGPSMEGIPMHQPKSGATMVSHREYPYWVSVGGASGVGPVQIGPPSVRWGYSKNPMHWITMDRSVRIAPHPWMQDVAKTIEREAGKAFGRKFYEHTEALKKEADKVSLRGFLSNE